MQMKKTKIGIILINFFIYTQVFAGLLENGTLDQINNSVAFGIAGLNLDYKETFLPTDNALDGTAPKSTEAGTILGLFFNTRTTFWEKIYTDLYFDYYNGKLKYNGNTPLYNSEGKFATATPFVSKIWHKFVDADIKAGYIFTFTESHSFQAIPYVGVGYRYWYRQHNNLAVQEKYQHYKAIGGLKLNWLLTDNFVVSPYIEGGKIFNARMKFGGSVRNDASMHGLKYELGNKQIYTAGLELNYKIFDEFFLNGFASYTQFKYGRSATQPNTSVEPDSKTKELKAGLGVRYSWLVN